MKKKYLEPEFELTLFSFEGIMGNYAVNSQSENKINVYDGDNPNDPSLNFRKKVKHEVF